MMEMDLIKRRVTKVACDDRGDGGAGIAIGHSLAACVIFEPAYFKQLGLRNGPCIS